MLFTLRADMVAKVEEEYVDPEPKQAILPPPANSKFLQDKHNNMCVA